MAHIFRVSELTCALKGVIEGQFPFVLVQGQVSNLARPASGHVYFSLKDEAALLNAVWFKGCQGGVSLNAKERYDPVTGEVLDGPAGSAWLKDGLEVLCAGRLSVYEPRGAYQLVAELVQDMGLGRFSAEFEALKQKLSALGWFDARRKRALPQSPGKVAVVTAPAAAALQDFLKVGSTRGTGAHVRVYPALVQGEAAPEQIARALDAANAEGWADVAVLIRGGGSLEDLWAFNTEVVAAAIHRSALPVLCGVGHEVDTTIADLVADVRAATPSHAAQMLWPERSTLAQRADELDMALQRAFARFCGAKNDGLSRLEAALRWLSPQGQAARLEERLSSLALRLDLAANAYRAQAERSLDAACARLERCGPGLWTHAALKVDELSRRLRSGAPDWLEAMDARLENIASRLTPANMLFGERIQARLELLAARLEGLDPQSPLQRGYVLARKEDGSYLRAAGEVSPGDRLALVTADGEVNTRVTDANRMERQ